MTDEIHEFWPDGNTRMPDWLQVGDFLEILEANGNGYYKMRVHRVVHRLDTDQIDEIHGVISGILERATRKIINEIEERLGPK